MHAVLELSSLYTFSEPAGGTEVRLHDGVDQRHRGRGSGASGRARLLAQAVAGMGRPSMRGHSCAAVHLREPFDGVSCSAPCRLVGSTASCEAQPVSLCTRWAHASMRAGRDPPAGFYAEFPHSTTSWAAHLATARPDPRRLYPTGRNKNSLPAARWKAHVSTCNGSLFPVEDPTRAQPLIEEAIHLAAFHLFICNYTK